MCKIKSVFKLPGIRELCKVWVRQRECLSLFSFLSILNDLEFNMNNTGAGVMVTDKEIYFLHLILNYGCEVWGFRKAPTIERVHLNLCKGILQVKRTTQNDFICDELGRYLMFVCRQICCLNVAFGNQGVGDTEISINLFKQRVYDIYKQSWESKLWDSSRATFYRAV